MMPDLSEDSLREAEIDLTVVVTTDSPPATPPRAPQRPPLQRDILAALSGQPATARQLARIAGRRYNSRFRGALAALVEDGQARRTRRGYALAAGVTNATPG
jgi:hypothetical protein